ncbi:MAG: phosphate ABC transporter ATP-binding protein PstB [Actinobacteria bacterium]|nr:phosphate ABC transporter ATP-binding protein PstB [Cyanobacteriota bacterium]MCL5771754.1 phosphate ABC transporter ATP-binding protein PstB [Actinomycetota bacterium]
MNDKVKVSVKNFGFFYGDTKVLTGINFDIFQNTVTSIIGPSGCGKSTLLRTFNRMNELLGNVKVEGDVKIDGSDIYKSNVDIVELRKKVGMVFQRPNPFPKSIYENVAYGPRLHKKYSKSELDFIVEDSLKKAALWDEVQNKLNKSALDLSGGQQQRLCIARVLAVESEILLMDEPASALDPISTQKIEDLITELKNNYTIIIVTHNMQQAARISQKTAFLLMEKQGEPAKLIEYDDTNKIFTLPSDKRTEDYITGRFG